MKAVAATRQGEVEVVDLPMPHVEDYEALVKVRACGLCNATDLKIIDDHLSNWKVAFPVIVGHEGVGEVVEVGSKVRNIQVGDRFTNPHGRIEPGTRFNRMWAGMVEYAVVQDQEVAEELGVPREKGIGERPRVPADISFADAAILLTLKECYSGIYNLGFREGMDVLVYGDGPVGRALVRFMRLGGAGWLGCIGHHDDRLAGVKEVGGADLVINSHKEDVGEALGDREFDMVIDAVGSTKIILESTERLKPGGKVSVYGVLKPDDCEISLLDLKNHTAVHMLNFPHREGDVHDEVVEMVQAGKIVPGNYYSHTVPIEDAPRGVEMIRSREALKVVFTMNADRE